MKWLSWVALMVQAPQVLAAVNDVFPADFVAMPAGASVLTAYAYERQSRGPYVNGKDTASWSMDASIGVLRLSQFFDAGGLRSAATIVAGYADQQLDGKGIPGFVNKSASGGLDLRLSGTVWPINQPELRHYLALNATVLAPTGSCRQGQLQNIGENRWRAVGSIGWIRGMGNRWTSEVIGEVAWYGANDAYFPGARRREQSPSAALTTYLRYRWDSGFQAYAGYQWNMGGETEIDGLKQKDEPRNQRASLGFIYPLAPGSVLNFRASRDLAIRNGFSLDQEIAVRIVLAF